MNLKPPPPPSSPLASHSNPLPLTQTLTLHWVSPPPYPPTISKPTRLFRFRATANPTNPITDLAITAAADPPSSEDQKLLILLRQRKTEEAWIVYTQSTHLPNPTCLSRLLSQLSYQNTRTSLARAQSIITRLRNERQLRHLDANSLGLLAVAAAKAGQTRYATSIVKSMLRSGFLPHYKTWRIRTS
ncbi:hypothetical protein M0R45_029361 [Rubus argutus]|uniref:At1g68980-like TPR repeats domain-containing protein n=1 Tax=Rubus argutus TaxID=59490 RepID=A0AAW1WAA8_RUBAR